MAKILRGWLPDVIQSLDPFMSSEDIDAGQRWGQTVAERLETTDFGIVCVTADNQDAPWLNFEAGALAKAIDTSRVVPLLIDVDPAQIKGPLAQFQAMRLDQKGLCSVLAAINALMERPLTDDRLERGVQRSWLEIEPQLKAIRAREAHHPPPRTQEDLLQEVLERVRELTKVPLSKGESLQRRRAVRRIVREFDAGASIKSSDAIGVRAALAPEVSIRDIRGRLRDEELDDVVVQFSRRRKDDQQED